MLKTTLFAAIEAASHVIVNGYEIDEYGQPHPSIYRLSCGEDYEFEFRDQWVEIDSDGCCVATDSDGGSQRLEFQVTHPLRAGDMPQ